MSNPSQSNISKVKYWLTLQGRVNGQEIDQERMKPSPSQWLTEVAATTPRLVRATGSFLAAIKKYVKYTKDV